MRLADPPSKGSPFATVIKTEEKGSDVNLAMYLLLDAFDDDYETAAIISNDSDLAEPIQIVRTRFSRQVIMLNPYPKKQSAQLTQAATLIRPIHESVLKVCQFPPILTDAKGTITKPAKW